MTALRALIADQIRLNGPMTLAEYMSVCLGHPEHGYYRKQDPLGAAGDFTTAPEISQMFGEMIGLWLASTWVEDGQPEQIVLAELGPGRGTLMADALRAAKAVPGFVDAARVHLVETSPALRDKQADALGSYRVSWSDDIEGLPQGPLYLIANEFFDALPIRQFMRQGETWAEKVVGLDEKGALAFGFAPPSAHGALQDIEVADGAVVETAAPGAAIAQSIGARIATHGGAALIVDYGDWDGTGDTFQALSQHEPVDPLEAPGDADLTAHVGFRPLAQAASEGGARAAGFATQGAFLERLGITARAETLAARLSGDALTSHIAAHRRLLHPDEMGGLFKVLAIRPPGQSAIGFADA
ncbi:MAG: SAM-dependent methyltransferase [Pseudomonadota bacterium]